MSNLLTLLFTKERPWVICSRRSLKRSDVSDSLVILANRLQKTRNSLEKFVFFVCFWQFFPFICPRANSSSSSLLIHSFLKSNLSNWLPSLFTKERQERFTHFHERIALSITKNKRIAQKSDKRIPNPAFLQLCIINKKPVWHKCRLKHLRHAELTKQHFHRKRVLSGKSLRFGFKIFYWFFFVKYTLQ